MRREVSSRNNNIIQKLAFFLGKKNVTPNTISVFSIIFSFFTVFGCYGIYVNQKIGILDLFLVLLGIQLRLLCNVIDGLVAIEGGKKTVLGGIYNEFPDRISDTIIIFSISFLIDINLGFIISFLAIMTAYVRLLGCSLGTKHYFNGPSAKQHRMFFLNLLMIIGYFLSFSQFKILGFYYLVFISILTLITIINRLRLIVNELESGNLNA